MWSKLLLLAIGFCCIGYSDEAVAPVKCEASKKPYMIEDKEFCDMFYTCENNIATESWCEDGLVYDVEKEICDLPFTVKCGQRSLLQDPIPSDNCPRQNGMFPVAGSCDKFHHCAAGHDTLITCPGGTIFSDSVGACVHADQAQRADCRASDVLDFVCPNAKTLMTSLPFGDHDRLPHPTSCRNFFMCLLSGEPRLGGCDYGLVFNPAIGRCDRPKKVPGCEKWYESDEQEEDSDPVASTSPPRIDDAGSKKTVVATTLRNPTLSETATEKPSVKSVPTRRAGNRFRSRTSPKPEE